jgi:DHA1 family tetracycline resistance protein-like MFS transporter
MSIDAPDLPAARPPDAPAAATRAPAVAFILVTIILDVLAFGIVAPVLPRLIQAFQHGDAALAAETYGVFATAWALMQFLFSPVLGMLSDRFGRRKVLLISLLGLGLDYLLMSAAPTLAWLFIGRVISGITAATYSTAAAYIADVTPPEQRAKKFGLIGAAWGLGFIAGPALGGILGDIDPRLPFRVAALLTLANAAYGWFVLPETLPRERRAQRFDWRRANPVGALALVRSRPGLAGLVAVQVLYSVAHYSLPAVFVLYSGFRYGWNARQVGLTLAFVGVCTAVVQGAVIGPAVRALGERRAVLAGLAAGAFSYVVYATAPTGGWLLVGIPIGALFGLYGPAAQALMTQRVGPTEQGRLQGVNGSVLGLVGLFAPAMYTFSFAQGIRPDGLGLPGIPYYLAAALTATALLLAVRVARPVAPPLPTP